MSGRRPSERPSKICAHCGLPFQWRRRWKDVWEEVRYCSARCRSQARLPAQRRERRDSLGEAPTNPPPGPGEPPAADAAKPVQKQGKGEPGPWRRADSQLEKKGKRRERH